MLLVQHKTVGMVMLIGAAIVAVGLVFNPTGAKDAMLSVFNTVIGGGAIMGVAPLFNLYWIKSGFYYYIMKRKKMI